MLPPWHAGLHILGDGDACWGVGEWGDEESYEWHTHARLCVCGVGGGCGGVAAAAVVVCHNPVCPASEQQQQNFVSMPTA